MNRSDALVELFNFVRDVTQEGLKTPGGTVLLIIVVLGLGFLIYSARVQSKKPIEDPDEILKNDSKFPPS